VVWWSWLVLLVSAALAGAVAVALQRPGRARDVTAWVGTVGFYVVLVAMFGGWAREALADGARGRWIGLGLLAALFAIGLVVALFKTVAAARRRGGPGESGATH